VPFKVIYSIVPPTVYAGGWACFFGALILVGGTTIIIAALRERGENVAAKVEGQLRRV
jgi:hypothetical protein